MTLLTSQSTTAGPGLKTVAFFAYEGVMSLDVSGPLEVFAVANHHLQQAGQPALYAPKVIGWQAGAVSCSSGLRLFAEHSCHELAGQIHTLLIAGGPQLFPLLDNEEFIRWLAQTGQQLPRVGSICTGAFALAQAGLLNGRRATTHWQFSAAFRERFPAVELCPDIVYVRDGPVVTSAGVTAGMDMALSLVQEDCGVALAIEVAKSLVLFLRRPGGQSQFSTLLDMQSGTTIRMRELINWLLDNLDKPLNVDVLAERACMSSRNFARIFLEETQLTPAKFINLARIERARLYLEQQSIPLKVVAQQCGFGSDERMRRAFVRHLNVLPQDYRQRFQGAV